MNKRTAALVLQLVGVGWYIALSIVVGLFFGLWLDQKLDSVPVFTILGVLIGVVLAFYGIYKMLLPILIEISGTKQDME